MIPSHQNQHSQRCPTSIHIFLVDFSKTHSIHITLWNLRMPSTPSLSISLFMPFYDTTHPSFPKFIHIPDTIWQQKCVNLPFLPYKCIKTSFGLESFFLENRVFWRETFVCLRHFSSKYRFSQLCDSGVKTTGLPRWSDEERRAIRERGFINVIRVINGLSLGSEEYWRRLYDRRT